MPRYRRNPALLPQWAPPDRAGTDGKVELLDGRSGRVYRVRPAVLGLLDRMSAATAVDELSLDGFDAPRLAASLAEMAAAGLVEECPDAVAPAGGSGAGGGSGAPELFDDRGEWSAAELAVHAQSARGGKPHLRLDEVPPARLVHPEALATVELPAPDPPSRPFTEVLAARRSARAWAEDPPSVDQLATLLGRSARVRGRLGRDEWQTTSRPSPSGGGRHSLELYLAVRATAGLQPGVYHYDPFGHALRLLAPWAEEHDGWQRRLLCAPMGVDAPPPVGVYLASWYRRTQCKYGGMTLSLIYRDAGCLLQTLYLVAADLGLACCATAAMEAAPTPGFLRPHRGRIVHAGNLALGRPAPGPAADPAPRPLTDEERRP